MRVLPNTAGCHSVKEAVTTAQMAREVFGTPWIKLEVIGDHDTLQPDVFAPGRGRAHPGGRRLPGVPLHHRGSDRGRAAAGRRLPGADALGRADRLGARPRQSLRPCAPCARAFRDVPMVIDAGIGLPSHAAQAMELGFDAVLLNTAVAKAGDPVAHGAGLPPRGRGRARGLSRRPDGRARHGRALDAGARHRFPGLIQHARPLLSDRRRRGLARAAAAARRPPGPAPGQGPARARAARADPPARAIFAPPPARS